VNALKDALWRGSAPSERRHDRFARQLWCGQARFSASVRDQATLTSFRAGSLLSASE
jgi:hypothetical protein